MGHEAFRLELWGDLSLDRAVELLAEDVTHRRVIERWGEAAQARLRGQPWEWAIRVRSSEAEYRGANGPLCPEISSDLTSVSVSVADEPDWDHATAAPAIAHAFVAAILAPDVTEVALHEAGSGNVFLAWCRDDEVFVTDFDPFAWAQAEATVEVHRVHRPAVIHALEHAGIEYREPWFGPRWAIDETHRFMARPAE